MAIRSVSALAALLVAQGTAVNAVAEEFEQHGAHEHGHAELMVAQSGKSLTVALESPAMNLVGFEHKARTPEHKAAVQTMLTQLRQGYAMVALDKDALCLLDTVDIRQGLLAGDKGHDEHKDHDDDEHKDHDGHEHDEHESAGETHSDIDVTWQFTCMQPAQLKAVKLGLFKAFPLLDELDVQWTSPAGQGATELSPQQTEFKF